MLKVQMILLSLIASAAVPLFTDAVWADESPFTVHDTTQSAPQATLPKLSSAKEYYARAYKADQAKDYGNAIRDYSEAIRLDPKYVEAIGNRGAARFNTQDIEGALSDYNAALKLMPNHKGLMLLKTQAETALANQRTQQNAAVVSQDEARRRAAILNQALMGGDFADPSTIIMMNAQRRGLIPATNP
jgi:tetratricopeptide (TPR) repeat protein